MIFKYFAYMDKLFKDRDLNEFFKTNGYAVVDVFQLNDIESLNEAYAEFTPDAKPGFHASMYYEDKSYRRRVDRAISDVTSRTVLPILNDFQVLYSNFMVKEPGLDGDFFVHQDWSYVDESQSSSLAVWFPLHDVDEHNGCLQFLMGSQKSKNQVRGYGTRFPFEHLNIDEVKAQMQHIPLRSGQAVFWDHRMVHYSGVNRSANPRISATSILVPSNVPVIHYYRNESMPENEVECFKADNDFFMRYNLGTRPDFAEKISTREYSVEPTSLEDLISLRANVDQN